METAKFMFKIIGALGILSKCFAEWVFSGIKNMYKDYTTKIRKVTIKIIKTDDAINKIL